MFDIRTELYVVKIALAYILRKLLSATIPSHLQILMFPMQILRKLAYILRIGIAAHEAYASNFATILLHKLVENHRRKRLTNVLPQILAVTARTAARTSGDVD